MNSITPDQLFLTIAPKLARIRLQADIWEESGDSRVSVIHKLCDQIALDAAAACLDSGLRHDPTQDRFTREAPVGNQTREDYIRQSAETQARWVRESVAKMPPSQQKHLLAIGCITQDEYDDAQRASQANPQLAKP